MSDKQIRLLGFVKIAGEIEALTGLHIGGTADSIDKGGIDSPVIKNPVTNEPYIPGSSLRGRMRSLLEVKNGKNLSEMTDKIWMEIYKTKDYSFLTTQDFEKFMEEFPQAKGMLKKIAKADSEGVVIRIEDIEKDGLSEDICKKVQKKLKANTSKGAYKLAIASPVCRLFGNSASDPGLPSVLIVRDAIMSEKSRKEYMKDGLPVTEAKMEIVVDRITAQAMPRTIERVPAGAFFDFEMIYKVQTYENGDYRDDAPNNPEIKCNRKLCEDLENILWALDIIEKHAGLGGNTSRGHGQVRFIYTSLEVRKIDENCVKVDFEQPRQFDYQGIKESVNTISFTIRKQ